MDSGFVNGTIRPRVRRARQRLRRVDLSGPRRVPLSAKLLPLRSKLPCCNFRTGINVWAVTVQSKHNGLEKRSYHPFNQPSADRLFLLGLCGGLKHRFPDSNPSVVGFEMRDAMGFEGHIRQGADKIRPEDHWTKNASENRIQAHFGWVMKSG